MQTQENAANASAAVTPGLEHGSTMGGATSTATVADATVHVAGAPVQAKKYETMGRSFETVEELTEYAKELERQNVEARMAAQKNSQNQPPQASLQNPSPNAVKTENGPALDQMLFTEPAKAIQKIKEEAKAEFRQELNAKDAERNFWKDFYDEHPDLRTANPVVQSITREKWAEIANVPLADAKKVIAKQARAVVEQIRGTAGTKVELTRNSASTLQASGGNPPIVPVVQDAPETFVAQLMKFRQKRKKG